MARRSPWLWDRFYKSTDKVKWSLFSAFWKDIHKVISNIYIHRLLNDMNTFLPDAVLSTHFFGMSPLLDSWGRDVPIYFVDTDFLSHRLQRDPRFSGWFVGSEEASRQHRADNIPASADLIKNFGIPISMNYASPICAKEARKQLGVSDDAAYILIAGGGIGAGSLGEVTDSMLDKPNWRIDVICGENAKLYESLRDKYYPFKNISVHGFVDDLRVRCAACDVLVIKPGGLSIAEAASAGTAMLFLDPLPGQEQYNCEYFLERGAALRLFEIRRAGEVIKELLEFPGKLDTIRDNARTIGRPFAAQNILSFIIDKVDNAIQITPDKYSELSDIESLKQAVGSP
jgi:processive 1,2-diacylglycerol beta-glucosyltransferase